MKEKRRHHRVSVDIPVILRHKGRLIPATAVNVSSSGMYIAVDHPEVSGSGSVEIIFDLTNECRDVSLRGQIVRMTTGEEKKIGVEFTNPYTVNHQALEKFINIFTNRSAS